MITLKPFYSSFVNSIFLCFFGVFGYVKSETPSITSLIPVFFGISLLIMSPGIKNENKLIAHIAVIFTFLILLGLIVPLMSSIRRSDIGAVIRIIIMIVSTILALFSFIKSFMNARKMRNENNI